MRATRLFFGSAISFLSGFMIFGGADVAQAQSICTCPPPSFYVGGGICEIPRGELAPITFNATCRAGTPQLGQLAASQQQLSFATVEDILRERRDQLQGPLGLPSTTSSPPTAFSAFNGDQGSGALDYASSANKNPLYKVPAPVAPVVAPGPSWAAWAEGLGDWERRGALDVNDIARTQSTYGVHAGFDGTWQAGNDYILAGVLSSWMSTFVNLSGSATTLRLEGPGLGIYSAYIHGEFSADLVGKVDFLNLEENFAGLAPNGSIGVTNAGVSGNVQYKYKMANAFIEPTMGFSFTRTMFGENAALMGLQDGSTLRLQAGSRAGAVFSVNGVSVEPTLAVLAYSNVIANGTTLATVPVPVPITPTDQGLLRGEVDPELNLDFNNGYSAYVRGSIYFGSELFGGYAKVGMRKQF